MVWGTTSKKACIDFYGRSLCSFFMDVTANWYSSLEFAVHIANTFSHVNAFSEVRLGYLPFSI
jgi:hypothetical protein